MGGGAGPEVLAGPLFCLLNEPLLFINKRRDLGFTLIYMLEITVISPTLSRKTLAGSDSMPVNQCSRPIVMMS